MQLNLHFIYLLSTLVACSTNNRERLQAAHEPLPNYQDTGYDTADPLDVAVDGTWHVSNTSFTGDTCGIANYQDVNEMVPDKFTIKESNYFSFHTDSTECAVSPEGSFTCIATRNRENALSGTATLNIKTTMSGDLLSERLMDLKFDTVIESCDGAGCFMIQMALSFPCPIIIHARGEA